MCDIVSSVIDINHFSIIKTQLLILSGPVIIKHFTDSIFNLKSFVVKAPGDFQEFERNYKIMLTLLLSSYPAYF